MVFARKVFSTVGLASVFDHDQVVSLGNLQNGVHVSRLTVKMDRNDRRYWPLGLLVKQFSGRQVLVAVGFEMLSQCHPIHAVSAFTNLDEVWQSSSVGDRLCRRDKRVWHCQYDIARPNSRGDQR